MQESKDQSRMLLLMVMLAIWAAASGYSLVFVLTVDPSGDGFTRGLNRISGFLGWQGIAGMFAIACFGVGRSFPVGSGVRHVSAVPLGMTLMLIIGLIGWALIST